MERKDTKVVKIGDRIIGGKNPILIQSMTNTKTEDVKALAMALDRLLGDPGLRAKMSENNQRQAVISSAVRCRQWKPQKH